jgi:hypothetical protein
MIFVHFSISTFKPGGELLGAIAYRLKADRHQSFPGLWHEAIPTG